MSWNRLTALMLVAAVAAAGCGSSDIGAGSDDPDGTSASATTASGGGTEFLAVNDHVRAEMERVAGTVEDGPFYMINLLDFRDVADYPEGSEWEGSTGAEANARYNEVSGPAIEAVGGRLVFVGVVEESLIDGPVDWDLVGIVRYPSRQAVIDLGENDAFTAATEHKDASLATTFAMLTDRIDIAAPPGIDPATIPVPPTDADPGFMMVHIIDFRDEAEYRAEEAPDDVPISGREAVDRYSSNAAPVAIPFGIRAAGWFEVQGTLLGDHQDWEQVRLNEFPSRAAFDALIADPEWAEGRFHRLAGIEQTYALVTAPVIYDSTFAA